MKLRFVRVNNQRLFPKTKPQVSKYHLAHIGVMDGIHRPQINPQGHRYHLSHILNGIQGDSQQATTESQQRAYGTDLGWNRPKTQSRRTAGSDVQSTVYGVKSNGYHPSDVFKES